METPTFDEMIATIDPALHRIADHIEYKYGNVLLAADDVYQNIVLALYERSLAHPDFLNQNPGYWIKFAGWNGAKTVRQIVRRDIHLVYDEPVSEPDGEEGDFLIETFGDPFAVSPERACIEKETLRSVWSQIGERDREIFEGLCAGYSAKELGSSKWAVCRSRAAVRELAH